MLCWQRGGNTTGHLFGLLLLHIGPDEFFVVFNLILGDTHLHKLVQDWSPRRIG